MQTKTERPTTQAIKKELKVHFPENTFKVRQEARSIDVYTDALHEPDQNRYWELDHELRAQGLRQNKMDELNAIRAQMDENTETERRIKDILTGIGAGPRIGRDHATGEVLQGGNRFVFVKPMVQAQWIG